MARQWLLDTPQVLDLAPEGGRVRSVVVALVAGEVSVVADERLPSGRVEVGQVEGLPLRVSWDGRTLKVLHGKRSEQTVVDVLKRLAQSLSGNRATVTIRVPPGAKAVVSTVSAPTTIAGLQRPVTVNTVSGALTLRDLAGKVSVNTVTGAVQCTRLHGEARLVTVSAPVTVQSSDLTSAKLNTVGGPVTLELTNGRAQVSANTVSGDVTVRAPFTGYAVTANTAGGHVVVDGQPLQRTASGGTGPSAPGSSGTGWALHAGDESFAVHANVGSATVTVVRTPGSGSGPQDAAYPEPSEPGLQDAPPDQWQPGSGP